MIRAMSTCSGTGGPVPPPAHPVIERQHGVLGKRHLLGPFDVVARQADILKHMVIEARQVPDRAVRLPMTPQRPDVEERGELAKLPGTVFEIFVHRGHFLHLLGSNSASSTDPKMMLNAHCDKRIIGPIFVMIAHRLRLAWWPVVFRLSMPFAPSRQRPVS